MVALGAPLRPRTRRRRTVRKTDRAGRLRLDARQRLLLLDTWLRSKLPAKDSVDLAARMIRDHLEVILDAIVLGATNAAAESVNAGIQRVK